MGKSKKNQIHTFQNKTNFTKPAKVDKVNSCFHRRGNDFILDRVYIKYLIFKSTFSKRIK